MDFCIYIFIIIIRIIIIFNCISSLRFLFPFMRLPDGIHLITSRCLHHSFSSQVDITHHSVIKHYCFRHVTSGRRTPLCNVLLTQGACSFLRFHSYSWSVRTTPNDEVPVFISLGAMETQLSLNPKFSKLLPVEEIRFSFVKVFK